MADKRTRPFEFVQPAGVVRRVSVLHAFDPDHDGEGGEFFFSVILSFRTRQRERKREDSTSCSLIELVLIPKNSTTMFH